MTPRRIAVAAAMSAMLAAALASHAGAQGGPPAMMPSAEGSWSVAAARGPAGVAALPAGLMRQPELDFADGRVTGNTACNQVMGSYSQNGTGLAFGNLASTRRACPPPSGEVERHLLDALGRTVSIRGDGRRLELLDRAGMLLAVLERR